ncbi:uncharacterized protein LOC112691074 [Sipha flava]|uniref:Uncharacterized protein LOC112691074 n=1 Tax=Sipha flava TaxID=143950 RepID=A0A8B8GDH3_9HEMI|nr:uncharacterized protein LOC112691074 [Sipha flava]
MYDDFCRTIRAAERGPLQSLGGSMLIVLIKANDGGDLSWSKTGVKDLIHLLVKLNKHENSFNHLQNEANFKVLGTMDIRSRIDSGYKLGIKRHNENYQLPLRGHDEKISSKNQGVFRGLINLCSDLDPSLQEHFQKSTVFKGIPVERFWGFFKPKGHDAYSLTRSILNEIDPIIEKNPQKFIAQAYDGAAVMSGHQSGVNVRIKEKYRYAYFIHCYAHQMNLITAQATSHNKQRVAILDEIVGACLPKTVQTRWNFNIRTVNMVYEHRDTLIECMEKIIDASSQSSSIN